MTGLAFLIYVLGVWRVTHLLAAEDGPFDAIIRLRRALGKGFWGRLMDCFYCTSLWVSVPFGWHLGSTWEQRIMLWLALSGGAILLERATTKAPALPYRED